MNSVFSSSQEKIKKPYAFTLPKRENAPHQNEDAFAGDLQLRRFAVADGVNSSIYSEVWAKLLTEQFCHSTDDENTQLFETQGWENWLKPAQILWEQETQKLVTRPGTLLNREEKFNRGDHAGATFIGVEYSENEGSYPVKYMHIGDSFLFIQKSNGHFENIEGIRSKDLNDKPKYFKSRPSNTNFAPKLAEIQLNRGDVLILATDKMAEWILIQNEQNQWLKAWQEILTSLQKWENDWSSFFKWIDKLRSAKENPLKDDDITLMVVPLGVVTVSNQEEAKTTTNPSTEENSKLDEPKQPNNA